MLVAMTQNSQEDSGPKILFKEIIRKLRESQFIGNILAEIFDGLKILPIF